MAFVPKQGERGAMKSNARLSLNTGISLGLFVAVFLLYFLTLCPTIHPGPSANAVCDVKGIGLTPPTAHPIWLILGRLLGSFSSNTAYVLNLMSAVFGALTIALLYALLSQFSHTRTAEEEARYQTHPYLRQAAALSGALLVAFSRPFWEGSILAGFDTLNTFFLVLIVFLVARYAKTSKARYAIAFGLLYGLAITNYPTLFVLAPIFIVFFLVRCRALLDDPVALVLVFICFGIGLLPALYEPREYVLQGKDYVVHAKTIGLAFSAFVDTYFRSMKQLFLWPKDASHWIFWLFLPTFVPVLFFMVKRGEYERGSPRATTLTYLVRYVFVFLFTVGGMGYLWGYRIGPVGMAGFDHLRYPRYLGSYVVVAAWLSYIVGYWLIVATGKFKVTGTEPEPKFKYRRLGYVIGVIVALALPVAGFVMNYSDGVRRSAKYTEHFAKGLLRSARENSIIIVPAEPFYESVGASLRYFQAQEERSPLGRGRTIIDLTAAYFDFYIQKRVEMAPYLAETVFGREVEEARNYFLPERPFGEVYDGILKCEMLRALEKKERPRPIYGLANNFFLSSYLAGNDVMNKEYRPEPSGLLNVYRSRLEYRDRPGVIKENERLWEELSTDPAIREGAAPGLRPTEVELYVLGQYSKAANDFGLYCQLAGQRDLAEKYYNRALTLLPDNISVLRNMASIMIQKGDKERAERLDKKYESLIEQTQEEQTDFLGAYGLALDLDRLVNAESSLAAESGGKAEARRLGILRLASEMMPQNARVREKIGDVLLSSGAAFSVEEARGEYFAALERTDPADKQEAGRIMRKLGRVYARLGNNSQAEDFFKKALDPDDPSTQLELIKFYADTNQNQAEIKRIATGILEKAPADQEQQKRLAAAKEEAAILMANLLLRSDGNEKAKEFLDEYLTGQPQQADLLLALAGQLMSERNLDPFTTWLVEKYRDLRKELPLPWLSRLAELYLRQGRYDVLTEMKPPLTAGPNADLAKYHYSRGLAYEALGKTQDALKTYEQARTLLTPESANLGAILANNSAWLYFKRGESERALNVVQEAAAADPTNSLIWDTYGWVTYRTRGDFRKAFDLIEASHLANPNVGIIAYHYGKLLVEKGLSDGDEKMKESGISVLTRAVELGIEGKEELQDAKEILGGRRSGARKGESST